MTKEKLKKVIIAILVMIAVMVPLFGLTANAAGPSLGGGTNSATLTGIKLSYKKSTMKVGEIQEATITYSPTGIAGTSIKEFRSSNPDVITVDTKGNVTALKTSSKSVTITVEAQDLYGNVKTGSFTFKGVDEVPGSGGSGEGPSTGGPSLGGGSGDNNLQTKITSNPSAVNLKIGETQKVIIKVTPSNKTVTIKGGTNYKKYYTFKSKKIAAGEYEVSITGVAEGKSIPLTAKSGTANITVPITITKKEEASGIKEVNLDLNFEKIKSSVSSTNGSGDNKLIVSETSIEEYVDPEIYESNGSNKPYIKGPDSLNINEVGLYTIERTSLYASKWSLSNNIEINQNLHQNAKNIKGKNHGEATIAATLSNGTTLYKTVKVGYFIDGSNKINVGESKEYTLTNYYGDVTWSSDSENIELITSKGSTINVKGKKDGYAVLKASFGNNATREVTICVGDGVELLDLVTYKANNLKYNMNQYIHKDILKNVTKWVSANTNVVTVGSNGKITPKKIGFTTAEGYTKDGKCIVKAKIIVYEIKLNQTINKYPGQSFEFSKLFSKRIDDLDLFRAVIVGRSELLKQVGNNFTCGDATGSCKIDVFMGETKIGTVNIKINSPKIKINNKKITMELKPNSSNYNALEATYNIRSNITVTPSSAKVDFSYAITQSRNIAYISDESVVATNLGKFKITVTDKISKQKQIFEAETKVGLFDQPTVQELQFKEKEVDILALKRNYNLSMSNFKFTPKDASTMIEYSIKDKKIAKIDGNKVVGLQKGETDLIATDVLTGKTANLHLVVHETLISYITQLWKKSKAFDKIYKDFLIAHSQGGRNAIRDGLFDNIDNAVLFDAIPYNDYGEQLSDEEALDYFDENSDEYRITDGGKKRTRKEAADSIKGLLDKCNDLDYVLAINTDTSQSSISLTGQYFNESLSYLSDNDKKPAGTTVEKMEHLKEKDKDVIVNGKKVGVSKTYKVTYKDGHTCNIESVMLNDVSHEDVVTVGMQYATDVVDSES